MKTKFINLLFLPLFLLQTATYAQDKLYVGTDATEFPPFEIQNQLKTLLKIIQI